MMAELKTRVDELKMENEYQLRLKDMNYNEKIKVSHHHTPPNRTYFRAHSLIGQTPLQACPLGQNSNEAATSGKDRIHVTYQ